MIKILCFPLTRIFFFITGFLGGASLLRAVSVTFNAVFRTSPGILNALMQLGLIPGIIIFFASVSLLLFAVMITKPKANNEVIYKLWRNLDGTLLILLAACVSFFLFSAAYNNWAELGAILLPVLAYSVIIIALSEICARVRDKELVKTLYWVQFYRTHPIWRPFGFLMTVLLALNLMFLILFTHEVGTLIGFRAYVILMRVRSIYGMYLEQARVDFGSVHIIFSIISISALTYFIVVLQSVEKRFARANADQIRAERFKSELITNVSHDIRTPLTSIINYVDLLKAQPSADDAGEYIAVLDKKSARLKTLIDDLMDASKAGTGNIPVEMSEINLAEMIGQIAGEFDERYIEKNLNLVLRGIDEPVIVYGDNRHLWRVLENLFSNTVKYALTGTRVFAELTPGTDKMIFSLKNTSAIPIEVSPESLTEQFIRGDRARESEGSGLGLYIAKSLVELMGCTFTIRTSGDLFEVEIGFDN